VTVFENVLTQQACHSSIQYTYGMIWWQRYDFVFVCQIQEFFSTRYNVNIRKRRWSFSYTAHTL